MDENFQEGRSAGARMLRPYSIGAPTGKVLRQASCAGVGGRVFPALLNFNNFVNG
jgi:hypothetical protein